MNIKRGLAPLIVFTFLLAFFLLGLRKNPNELPSALINHKVPDFHLHDLNGIQIDNSKFVGKTVILNIWASWCYACLKEHQELFNLAKKKNIELIGVNYKDSKGEALKWISKLQNPYKNIIFDPDGQLGLDLGVYGVPETFVIDRNNTIRMRIAGPITDKIIEDKINPLIKSIS